MRTVIINGLLAHHTGVVRTDIAFEEGVITAVGEHIPQHNANIINAQGRIVMPGSIDAHTHAGLRLSQNLAVNDGFYAATLAAAYGGVTCLVEHISSGSAGCALDAMPNTVRREAEGNCIVDYALHGVFQHADDATLAAIATLVASGIPTFKAYMTYANRQDDAALLRLLKATAKAHGLLIVHAENHHIIQWLSAQLRAQGQHSPCAFALSRPPYAETEAVTRLLAMARATDAPVYVAHVSTTESAAIIAHARASGQRVFAETCPQYLLLTHKEYANTNGLAFVMAPPLREPADNEGLWQALRDGTIDVVATDHCAFSLAQKQHCARESVFDCPGGVAGIETRVPLLFTEGVLHGRISLERFIDVLCTTPARLMGLARKGTLALGMDADIVILDPNQEKYICPQTLHQKTDSTPFEDLRARGWPTDVWVRGQKVLHNGMYTGVCVGQYVERQPLFEIW